MVVFHQAFLRLGPESPYFFIREGRTKDKEVASTRPIYQSMATQNKRLAPSEEREIRKYLRFHSVPSLPQNVLFLARIRMISLNEFFLNSMNLVDPSNCVTGAGARARGEPNLMESCPCRSFRAVSISRVGRG